MNVIDNYSQLQFINSNSLTSLLIKMDFWRNPANKLFDTITGFLKITDVSSE